MLGVSGVFHCGIWTLQLWCVGSEVAVCGLSCSAACGILDLLPGIKLTSLASQGWFLTTGPPGKSQSTAFLCKGRNESYLPLETFCKMLFKNPRTCRYYMFALFPCNKSPFFFFNFFFRLDTWSGAMILNPAMFSSKCFDETWCSYFHPKSKVSALLILGRDLSTHIIIAYCDGFRRE